MRGVFKFENINYVPSLAEQAAQGLENCKKFCQDHALATEIASLPDGSAFQLFNAGHEYAQYIDTVSNIKDSSEFGKSGSGLTSQTFISAVNKFDEMRGTDFHKTFPELKSFWEFCNV